MTYSISALSITLNDVPLSITIISLYTKNAECHYAERRVFVAINVVMLSVVKPYTLSFFSLSLSLSLS
jgi:hypothetical protein